MSDGHEIGMFMHMPVSPYPHNHLFSSLRISSSAFEPIFGISARELGKYQTIAYEHTEFIIPSGGSCVAKPPLCKGANPGGGSGLKPGGGGR